MNQCAKSSAAECAERTKQNKRWWVKTTDWCEYSRDKVEIPLDKPVGTIKCKNWVTIIKNWMAGFDGVETRLVFLPLEALLNLLLDKNYISNSNFNIGNEKFIMKSKWKANLPPLSLRNPAPPPKIFWAKPSPKMAKNMVAWKKEFMMQLKILANLNIH